MSGGLEPIRVLVADDHPLFRDGIARAVQGRPDLVLVAATADGRETLERLVAERPDVAVVDLRMPGVDGLGVLETIRRQELATRVIVLSAFTDPALVYEALARAPRATSPRTPSATRSATRSPARPAARRCSTRRSRPACWVDPGARRRRGPRLTPREREVLELITDGPARRRSPRGCTVSTPTIKTHLAHVYEKLGVSDRAAAVAEGMRRGIVR